MAHGAVARQAAVVAAALLACAWAVASGAATAWQLEPARSSLAFRATQAGAEFEGQFKRFTATIQFDPGDLAGSAFDVGIDIASAATLESERDALLQGPDWFAAAEFPKARFTARRFRKTSTGYAADGTLALRGASRPVTVAFTFARGSAGRATLQGNALLRRLDFGVGQGEWRATEWIADEVKVVFTLRLRR